ncbi:MAG: hypothetical protein FWD35_00445 [Oscillospiraceae bacterium]|nr:hypothetical protein [Oscillospiraceae bacterium]
MPIIPQISTPFQGKGYQTGLGNQKGAGGEQFEIIELTKPQSVADAAKRNMDDATRQLAHNREDLPQLMVKTAKDPTMAVETLKQLMGSELLATAAANGYTELHGELETLSKSIYLNIDALVQEILNQEEQTTMFSGNRLFDLLRGIAGNAIATNNEDAANAIANFLKAVNFSFNRGEILNALAANMRFLATYFQPSAVLSDKLTELANAWASQRAHGDFAALKDETVRLLYNVSESLLNNDKTQILIPLIIHNLSRYNTNDYMLKESFSGVMVHVPHAQKGAFMTAFDEFLDAVLKGVFKNVAHKSAQSAGTYTKEQIAPQVPQDPAKPGGATIPVAAEDTEKLAAAQAKPAVVLSSGFGEESFPALYAKSFEEGRVFPPMRMTEDSLANGLRGVLLGKLSGMDAVTLTLTNLIEGAADARLLVAMQADLAKIDSLTMLVNYLNDILKPLPDVPERQILFNMLSEIVAEMSEKGELPQESKSQAQGQNAPNATVAQELANLNDLKSAPVPQGQAQGAAMPETAEGKAAPPPPAAAQAQAAGGGSALEELTAFIEKNINHSALKSLDSYNASNLLQSLINAPGVYTPLAHFVIPLQIGNARAFGELWVDNEDKNSGGRAKNGGENYHLFLTFEVEHVGRFEADMYAHGKDISVAILHPEGFTSEMAALRERVSQIIASTDYTVKELRTGVLRVPHDLTQIFPRILDKRTGLDITI